MKTLLLLALTTSFTLAQGDLNPPPGGPTATMKTLDQLEARTPIHKTSGSPVAGPHFIISQPGSYYLTGNITVSTGDAIVITAASDVSIDLNGFTIASALVGDNDGTAIKIPGGFTRLIVKNGSIRSGSTVPLDGSSATYAGFTNGIATPLTAPLAFGSEALISGVHVHGCAANGIFAGKNSIVEHCTAKNNGGFGIAVYFSSVTGCNVTNGGGYGIFNEYGSITNCNASLNRSSGILANYCAVVHCVAVGNSSGSQIVLLGGERIGCVPSSN
jgi:Right handed beta helix region